MKGTQSSALFTNLSTQEAQTLQGGHHHHYYRPYPAYSYYRPYAAPYRSYGHYGWGRSYGSPTIRFSVTF